MKIKCEKNPNELKDFLLLFSICVNLFDEEGV